MALLEGLKGRLDPRGDQLGGFSSSRRMDLFPLGSSSIGLGDLLKSWRCSLVNAWNVQFIENGVVKIKVFEGDSPKQAVAFAKEQRRRGLVVDVEVISRRQGFAPPLKHQVPPRAGLLWCPYCIKWREFEEAIIVRPDYETPPLLRCSVCTISIKDYWVRRYNPDMVARMEVEAELKKTRVPDKKVKLRRRR